MDYEKICIPLEVKLNREIFSLLQGDVLLEIMQTGLPEKLENRYQQILLGHSFKVTADLAPVLYAIFVEVKETLEFDEDTEFYVNNSPELNAFAFASLTNDYPHIININSGLVQALDNRELRFVIGHEFGHIISNNSRLDSLINFIYPDKSRTPILLRHKIMLWQKLAELTADRFGYIACGDLASTVSGFFKISSGLDTKRMEFNYKAYLEENQKLLDSFINSGAANILSHPVNPIRIKAIEAFAGSALMNSVFKEKRIKQDPILNSKIDEICKSLLIVSNSPLNYYRQVFIATAGILASSADKQMNDDEYLTILETLSQFTVFPAEFLDTILKSGKVNEMFNEAVVNILAMNPGERYAMIDMMFTIIQSDHKINKHEIDFLFGLGTKLFGMTVKEMAQVIAGNLQQSFVPLMFKEMV